MNIQQFIDHTENKNVLINLEHITSVEDEGTYRILTTLDGYRYNVREDYQTIKLIMKGDKKCQK